MQCLPNSTAKVKLCRLLDREIKEASKRQTLQAAWSCYAFTKLRQPPNVELCRPDIWMPANFLVEQATKHSKRDALQAAG